MAHRRGGFRGRGISDSQRRKKTWITTKIASEGVGNAAVFQTAIKMETADTASAIGSFTNVLFAAVTDPDVEVGEERSTLPEECTILRVRGSLLFPKTNGGIATLGRVSDQYAFGFGVTDIRSIVSDTRCRVSSIASCFEGRARLHRSHREH